MITKDRISGVFEELTGTKCKATFNTTQDSMIYGNVTEKANSRPRTPPHPY